MPKTHACFKRARWEIEAWRTWLLPAGVTGGGCVRVPGEVRGIELRRSHHL